MSDHNEYRRAYMVVMLYGIKEKYGIYAARRIIKEVGKATKMRDVTPDNVEAVITECDRVIASLGDTPGPAYMARKLAQKRA